MSQMRRMQSRVVIVTGSTQGLGEGIATCFAREGASVVLNGRSQPRGEALENKLRGIGASVKFFPADLSVKEAAQQLVHDAARHFGRLDVLVNNAQIVPDLLDAESAASDSALEVALRSGLYASLWTSQAALPYFKKAGGGRIVNFASLNGVYGSKYGVAYNAAKEGIRGLTRTLANEWGGFNVTVNVILPSGMSPSYQAFYKDDPKKADAVAKLNPMRRHGRVEEDIGKAVLGLASETARYITGQSLFIDGGSNLLGLPQLHSAGIRFQ